MAVPTNKEELKKAIAFNYAKLKNELSTVPPAIGNVRNMDGHAKGTMMSVNNLLSYLLGWGELVLKWNVQKDTNEAVHFPEKGYKWNELGKLAQKFYQDYEAEDFNSLCQQLDATVFKLLALIDRKTNAELYEEAWYEKWTLGRMIQFNTSSPYSNARGRLRKWKKEQQL